MDPFGLEPGEFFETYYDALEDWTSIYFPQSEYGRIEMGSALYYLNNYGYAYTEPVYGLAHSVRLHEENEVIEIYYEKMDYEAIDKYLPGYYDILIGYIHAHPNSYEFSPYDLKEGEPYYIFLASRSLSGSVDIQKYYSNNGVMDRGIVKENVTLNSMTESIKQEVRKATEKKWKNHFPCVNCKKHNISKKWPYVKR